MLSIDLYGHGDSDGRFEDITVTKAAQDVAAAVNFLQRQKRINPYAIGALGHSMGGTAVLMARAWGASLKTLALVAPVGDTRYHARHRYTAAEIKAWRRTGWIHWTSHVIGRRRSLRYAFYRDLQSIDTIRLAKNIHQPVLIIHETQDGFVPLVESRHLFRTLHEPKQLAVVRGADHDFSTAAERRRLFGTILPWLEEYLAQRTSRVVNVFIRNHGEYLIVKRSNQVGYYRGRWAIVSGHLVRGVSVLAQAYYEAREEAGLRRSDLKLIRVGPIVKKVDADIGKTWLITSVLMESSTRRVRLDWEHTAHKWVALQRFPFKQSYPGIERQFKALGLL